MSTFTPDINYRIVSTEHYIKLVERAESADARGIEELKHQISCMRTRERDQCRQIISLMRIIEAVCCDYEIEESCKDAAPHHYRLAKEFQNA